MAAPLTSEQRRRDALVIGSVVVLTASYRFLTLRSFPNDHFIHMTAGSQMLFGEWPVRDFQDQGHPLMSVMSAIGQALMGQTLLADAIVTVAAFSVAAALTVILVRTMTGSTRLAVGAAAIEVLIFPRSYSYPKVLVYAAVFLLLQRYVAQPTTARRLAMALGSRLRFSSATITVCSSDWRGSSLLRSRHPWKASRASFERLWSSV